ncbi:response regulator receiver domain-containing protein [Mucilaginibacter yixingensis]|uniref:Response regulator receiver domain-containing protein n=2 Tax=Mucilaginibacter yixingensis TaxID=1295612 RepID=A0A2T5JGR7_9SPHI|nr:response regulator receiver domain-containing protein [Mucilaginibacter yixingensis]
MVIEDEPVIGEMMCILLEMEGYEVISLGDTGLARLKLHAQEVAMVMLDLGLKGENGQSMCAYIKAQDDLKNIPVVLVSANQELEQITAEIGADDYIRKPFEMEHFLQKVNNYARLKSA